MRSCPAAVCLPAFVLAFEGIQAGILGRGRRCAPHMVLCLLSAPMRCVDTGACYGGLDISQGLE